MNNQEINQNDQETLVGSLNIAINAAKRDIEVMLPCKIVDVNSDRTRVNVQPLIKLIDQTGALYHRAEIRDIPIVTHGGGNFLISFNVSPGDTGWIKANDRDISIFKQNLEESGPNTARMHSFSDAVFLPDIMTGFSIDQDETDALTIQNKDGSISISLSDNKIKLKHPSLIEVATENYNVVSSNTINLNGLTIDSSGACESPVEFKAPNVVGDTDVKAGAISLTSHIHQSGLLISGAPGSPVTGTTGGAV